MSSSNNYITNAIIKNEIFRAWSYSKSFVYGSCLLSIMKYCPSIRFKMPIDTKTCKYISF